MEVIASAVQTADAMTMASVPEWDRQFGLVRIHDEHREELGRLRLAGVGADAVAVAGQLGEALSGLVGRHRSVVDVTADRLQARSGKLRTPLKLSERNFKPAI